MRLLNNSQNALMHEAKSEDGRLKFYLLEVGKTLEVPDEVGEIWLKHEGVTIYIDPADFEAEKAKAVKEALEAERAKEAKTAKPKTKKK